MFTDFIEKGQGYGLVGNQLREVRYDPGMLRPFIDADGVPRLTVNTGHKDYDAKEKVWKPVHKALRISDLEASGVRSPVTNATSLRKEDWIELDKAVLRAARQRLRAWADLSAANSFGGFDGMSKMMLEHETMSDPGEAIVDMDALTEGRTDSPLFQLEGLPLPITHSDFWFSERRLTISRNSSTPLDSVMAEAAGRRVAEVIEKTLIGVSTGVAYGGGSLTPTYGRTAQVYGYTNFPNRLTFTGMAVPVGTNAAQTVADVLNMRSLLYNNRFYGPFMIYHSIDWDQWLDNDYILSGGNVATQSLRDRLRAIDGIMDVRRLDFLTNTHTMLLVQMTPDVCRAVNGMNITTVQWPSQGGMRQNFKVMAIQVPQLRADYNGRCGMLHGTTIGGL